jgi:hypothetical protein
VNEYKSWLKNGLQQLKCFQIKTNESSFALIKNQLPSFVTHSDKYFFARTYGEVLPVLISHCCLLAKIFNVKVQVKD